MNSQCNSSRTHVIVHKRSQVNEHLQDNHSTVTVKKFGKFFKRFIFECQVFRLHEARKDQSTNSYLGFSSSKNFFQENLSFAIFLGRDNVLSSAMTVYLSLLEAG